jgi:vacuolar-type H+-ATPase subunit H
MLNLLRQIQFPNNVKLHSLVIRRKTLNFARDHGDILAFAQAEAKEIVEQAKRDAEAIRQNARQELARDLQKDVRALGQMAQNRVQTLNNQAKNVCIDICSTALQEFLGELPEALKINKLISTLLERSLGTQNLLLECAEEQLEIVQSCLGELLSQQMAIRHWEVKVADDLEPYQLRIRAAKGSEINISMANLMALYEKEIKNLQRDIEASINTTGEHHEKVD